MRKGLCWFTGFFAVVVCLLAACSRQATLSVESIVEEHRAEITAFVERIAAVRAQLGSAPTERNGFDLPEGALTSENTMIVAEVDFDGLRTDMYQDRHRDRFDWSDATTVRPKTDSDLTGLIDDLRDPPRNPPNTRANAIEAIQRRLARIPQVRYVAVVRTEEAISATVSASRTTFTPAFWRGNVVLWDLEAGRWVGSIAVSHRDERTLRTIGSVTSVSAELNREFNSQVHHTVHQAVERGTSLDGPID
ncbi:MAG: hypothetical protein JW797_13950 [Bradymonadales bacterium]|nr:hypothetical protein [Bradymonadales bacterium]